MYIDLDGGTEETNTVDLTDGILVAPSKIDIVDIAFLENEIFDLKKAIDKIAFRLTCNENEIDDLQLECYK